MRSEASTRAEAHTLAPDFGSLLICYFPREISGEYFIIMHVIICQFKISMNFAIYPYPEDTGESSSLSDYATTEVT